MKHTQLSKMFYATLLVALTITAAHAQGVITTIAGTGAAGLSGDGGPATAAVFSDPEGVAVDASGNIYIADKMNARIRMVAAATGNVSTVAGTTLTYVMHGMGGLATAAGLIYPNALCVDNAGNYYASDWYADAAYEVNTGTGIITNICGHDEQGCTGDGGLAPLATMAIPGGIAIDNWGNKYIADFGNSRLRKVDYATGIVTTIASSTIGGFSSVNGVCADDNGNVYISDYTSVKRLDALGNFTTIATGLSAPGGLFINISGDLFICCGNKVLMLNTVTGVMATIAGTSSGGYSGDGGSPLAARLSGPTGVWQDASGAIYIADAGNNRIRKITGAVAYRVSGASTLTQNDVSIFPNPSAGTFTVRLNTYPVNGAIEVYNVIGEKVFSENITQQEATFNLNQPSGLYTVVLKTTAGNVIRKVTIAK